MDGLMRDIYNLPPPNPSLFRCQRSISSGRSQGRKSEITNLHSPSFNLRAPFQPVTSLKIVPQSFRNRPESLAVKESKELRVLHSELVITSRKFENWEIPSSSFSALESKSSSKSTKASTLEVQKSTKLKSELWFFHCGLDLRLQPFL
jgi:hypothetical protein